MSRHLPVLKAKDVIKILRKLGFYEVRTKGSHVFFKHPDGRVTLVPVHRRENIGKVLLHQIMREVKITPEEFSKLL